MEQLPPRIARLLFSKLSISNLPACRLVCKSWNRQVLDYAASSPKIEAILFCTADYHSLPGTDYVNPKIHCFDISTLNFVGSCTIHGPDVRHIHLLNHCNGLLFIEKGNIDIDCEGIFNPMTHGFFQTPICELHYALYHGFGYSPKSKQYKLFRAHSGCELKVLRFGRRNHNVQWASVSLPSPVTLKSHGVYMDGVVYYTGKQQDQNDQNDYIIYALDVETENFQVIATLEVGSYSTRAILRPFNGTIYAIVFMPSQVQLWRMERKDFWVRDFIISGEFRDTSIDLLKASEDGSIFLRITNDLFCLNKSLTKNLIKTLIPYDRRFRGTCLIQSLHFGSLPNILAGHH